MLLNVPSSFKRPDGRWEHHVRQSDIERASKCLELHRRHLTGQIRNQDGDAALVGSACHEAFAWGGAALRDGADWHASDVLEVGQEALAGLWREAAASDSLHQVQVATYSEASQLVTGSVTSWIRDFLPILQTDEILGIEHQFDIKVHEDYFREIYLSGTYDLKLKNGGLFDYKNSSENYNYVAWKLSRYNSQPRVYCWADDMEEGILGNSQYSTISENWPNEAQLADFTYVNFRPENRQKVNKDYSVEMQIVSVTPSICVGDCRFLLQQMLAMVKLIEAKVNPWPLGASDWWCSEKWCPAWSDCRGKYLPPDHWGLLAKVEENLEKRR